MLLLSLFTVTAAVAAPVAGAQAQTIEVRLSNFAFAPKTIELKANRDYALTLINDSGGGHSFSAKEFFAAAVMDSANRLVAQGGKIEVPGDERRTIRFRTAGPAAYKVKCTHALHGAFGMKGEIVVR